MLSTTRSAAIIGVVGLAAGGYWFVTAGEQGVEVPEELRDQAREDGSGAAAVAIGADARAALGAGLGPATLSEARVILDRAGLAAAHERVVRALAVAPEDGALHVIRSELARRLRAMPEALESGRRGAELLPTSAEAHFVFARALGVELMRLVSSGPLGMFSARKKVAPYTLALETATGLDPAHVDALKERILFLAFTPSIGGGDLEAALALLPALEAIDPIHGPLTRARCLQAQGDDEAALALCRRVGADFPESQEPPWVEAGLLVDMRALEDAASEAVRAADAALARVLAGPREETYYQALFQRAELRTKTGYGADEVLAFMDEYLVAQPGWEWAPSLARAHVQRGLALAALGRVDEARAAFEAALGLDPELAEALAALDAL
jgi:tetratricopeptide (TPR) repeat protein